MRGGRVGWGGEGGVEIYDTIRCDDDTTVAVVDVFDCSRKRASREERRREEREEAGGKIKNTG